MLLMRKDMSLASVKLNGTESEEDQLCDSEPELAVPSIRAVKSNYSLAHKKQTRRYLVITAGAGALICIACLAAAAFNRGREGGSEAGGHFGGGLAAGPPPLQQGGIMVARPLRGAPVVVPEDASARIGAEHVAAPNAYVGHPAERTKTEPPTAAVGHASEHTRTELPTAVSGHPAEHTRTEPPTVATKHLAERTRTPSEHTRTEPPTVVAGHPAEHTRTEPPSAVVGHPSEHTRTEPPTVVAGHPAEHTRTEPPTSVVGHPVERTRTEAPAAAVGHPSEHTRTELPTAFAGHPMERTRTQSSAAVFGPSRSTAGIPREAVEAKVVADLLDDVEVRELATESLAFLGAGALTGEDRPLVSDVVASTLHDTASRLRSAQLASRRFWPSGATTAGAESQAAGVEQLPMGAVLVAMGLLGDLEVQRIGLEVSRVLASGGNAPEEADSRVLRQRLEAHLVHRMDELRQMHDRLVPAALHRSAAAAATGGRWPWRVTLSPANVRAMRSAGGHWSLDFGALAQLDLAQTSASILAGALEETNAILAIVDLCSGSRLFGHVSHQIVEDAGNLISELSCQAAPGAGQGENLTKAMACPPRFGLQGLEALLAVPSLLEASS